MKIVVKSMILLLLAGCAEKKADNYAEKRKLTFHDGEYAGYYTGEMPEGVLQGQGSRE